jgi:DDE superfamily endonuclease
LIEDAYRLGAALGLAVWTQDEAGPFQTVPYPGGSWAPAGLPAHQPHEYVRDGTAKLLTLFHPASGRVRVKGVTSCPNAVLHPWLEGELAAILAALPPPALLTPEANRAAWAAWQAGLTTPITLPPDLPPLRMLLVLDNLAGHLTPSFVLWLFAHGIMPLYTPLGGSWLNMAESIQRVLKRRALEGTHPTTPAEIISALEATARAWNRDPTPFVWGGRRAARRERARQRRHALGGSGATTYRPLRRRAARAAQWRCA